jgi:hypothetical protein
LFRRQLRGEVGPVAEDQRPHFVIYRLDHIEGFNLATDGRKFFCRKYPASENLNGPGSPRKRPKSRSAGPGRGVLGWGGLNRPDRHNNPARGIEVPRNRGAENGLQVSSASWLDAVMGRALGEQLMWLSPDR